MDTGTERKTVIVTGGNSGLGYECGKTLSATSPGWHVILAVRDADKGARAANSIAEETGNRNVEAMVLDLAKLDSIRSFSRMFTTRTDLPPLRAVVCNAGLQVVSGTSYTDDGFEMTFGVNHLGHFLLVNLLLEHLDTPARIVFVSSGTHDPKRRTGMPAPRYRSARELAYPERHPDPEEVGEAPGLIGRRRYTTSKLCNIMSVYELDHRLRVEGIGRPEAPISVNAFDPGGMPSTGLTRDYRPATRIAWNVGVTLLLPLCRRMGIAMSTAHDSGRALAHLVMDPAIEGVSGGYFEMGKNARSSEESYDRNKAIELWETSVDLVGLRPEESPLRITQARREAAQ